MGIEKNSVEFEISKHLPDRSDFSLASGTDGWLLRFQTPWATWEEKILRLDSVELILEHNSKRYFYKRQYPTDGQP